MRFNLRTLMYLVAITAIALAVSVPLYRWTTFDYVADAEARLKSKDARIVRLRDKTGFYIAILDLSGTKITDDDIKLVRLLNPINEIDLSSTSISDGSLEHLKGMHTLRIRLSEQNHSATAIQALRESLTNQTEIILE